MSIHLLQSRRQFLRQLGVLAVWPAVDALPVHASAAETHGGVTVPAIVPVTLAPGVYCIVSPWGFPSPENLGMMSNVTFLTTQNGVVVIDSGSSRQIGEMALRAIRQQTDAPVVAVINTHYHGDHWLGNHAFVAAYPDVPIYAHENTIRAIKTGQGEYWTSLMDRSTDHATVGTVVTPPTRPLQHADVLSFGDMTLKIHHYGTAHTPADICVEIVERKVVHVGDVAMDRRIANMDDGSFLGSFKTFDALQAAVPGALWIPGHGEPSHEVLASNRQLFEAIYQSAEKAVREGVGPDAAKQFALQHPFIRASASEIKGFDDNIGKYASLAYLEAESAAF
ncbi:MBL fold metallo-hydrolase [Halothiobacillus sp. DCM-1]|uniref:MBL fold metallo-hydrolase n=1 Tax=Halothiobacillus sp. DCM-1 TaxID=3112558 RepID=UPI00324E3C6A